jgi:hypothetical protein
VPFPPNYYQERKSRADRKARKALEKQDRRDEKARERKLARGPDEPEAPPSDKEPADGKT